jgi:hypothetical protein
MRTLTGGRGSRLPAGWILPLALLAVPGCRSIFGLQTPVRLNEDPGNQPWSSVVFCDIEKPRRCATDADKLVGIRLSAGAVSLVAGERALIGLDDSADARAHCSGEPEAIDFRGAFPDGIPVCLNCSQIGADPAPFPDAASVCVAKCEDLMGAFYPPDPAVVDFCVNFSRPSVNFVPTGSACFDGACTDTGMLRDDFDDPRRLPEPVEWTDLMGVMSIGPDLVRTSGGTTFNAGADATQVITRGDAYVEFTAVETTDGRAAGFSEGPPPDVTPTLANINFGLEVERDDRFYVFERGVKAAGPDINQSFGRYTPFETFRVHVRDNGDGTGVVSYALLTSSCTHPASCPETIFYTSPTAAHYPLRIDTSFREPGGTLRAVRVVRIH